MAVISPINQRCVGGDASDRGARFQMALASTDKVSLQHHDVSGAPKSDGRSGRQDGRNKDEEDNCTDETKYEKAGESPEDSGYGDPRGGTVSNVLAAMILESARKPARTELCWRLIIPLERARFPDSAVLMSAQSDVILVQFRSCSPSLVTLFSAVVDQVGGLVRHGVGRPIQCSVCQVSDSKELYK